VNLPA